MKLVNIKQEGEVWLQWRESGHPASEAGAVMNEGPHFPKTRFDLFLLHTGQKKVFVNDAMRKGKELESKALKQASMHYDLDFHPACAEKGEFLASFDGLAYRDGKPVICEVKVTKENSDLWNDPVSRYKWQCTHQAIVAGVDMIILCVYAHDTVNVKFIELEIKDEWKTELIKAWKEYDDNLMNFKPPALVEGKDYVQNDSEIWAALAQEYQALNAQKSEIEKQIANVKTELLKLADNQPTKGAGISCYPVVRKGNVDYNKIPELNNVDLEQYRKAATSYWVIK